MFGDSPKTSLLTADCSRFFLQRQGTLTTLHVSTKFAAVRTDRYQQHRA